MKSNILTIIKKEFARFFGDKRMVFTAVLMPGLLIYVMYSFMGSSLTDMATVEDDYTYRISVVNMPQMFAEVQNMENLNLEMVEASEIEAKKELIKDEELDLLAVFPENFDQDVAEYPSGVTSQPAPNIELYYNSSSTESSEAYQMITGICEQTEAVLANKFDICAGETQYDLATEEDMSAMFMGMLLPMLILTFLFSGCLGIAAESIAGEKERGTIATLLVTPMKRSELAMGKLISLSAIGLLSGCSSFLGTMLALPKLMGGAVEEFKIAYEMVDYIWLFGVILSTTFVIVGLISVISAFTKSVKEASTATTPLMLLVVVLGLSSMMGGGVPEELQFYLIPIYNSVQCMTGIFNMEYSAMNVVVAIAANLVFSGVLVAVLTKIFDSERIMYT